MVAEARTTSSSGAAYAPRAPDETVLYHVLQEHLETFLERVEQQGRRLPRFVVDELRGFLRCGVRAYGFARVRCPSCCHEFAVAFSCKGRGFCPSCGGRFMGQSAAHLVDNVLPEGVGYRQWVLTLPFDLRYRVAFDSELSNAILRSYAKTLSRWYLRRAEEAGVASPQWGGVTVLQRFGSALQLTPHFHTIACDGVFELCAGDERAQVRTLPPPTDRDVEALVEEVHGRVVRVLRHRGLLLAEGADYEVDPLSVEEPSLASCYAQAIRSPRRLAAARWSVASGARAVSKSALNARFGGFDLHANVTVSAHDRSGLERLCRYVCRPALSHERLELLDESHVGLQLKTRFSDGTTHLVLEFDELLQRLCALVPRPRRHRVRYHGVLAPAARHRGRVVPLQDAGASELAGENVVEAFVAGDEEVPDHSFGPPRKQQHESRARRGRVRRLLWAELLQRVFGIDALKCPKCGGRMRVIATIIEAKVVRAILESLGLPSDPPDVQPSRGPPDVEMVEYQWC